MQQGFPALLAPGPVSLKVNFSTDCGGGGGPGGHVSNGGADEVQHMHVGYSQAAGKPQGLGTPAMQGKPKETHTKMTKLTN